MGNKVLIYDSGQTYEIDSELIYTPWFVGKSLRSIDISKSDTVSENNEDKDENTKRNSGQD